MDAVLVYADIKLSEDSSSRRSTQLDPVQQADHQLCPRWHRTALLLAWTGNVLLMVAVIVMGAYRLSCSSSTPLNRNPQNPEKMTGTPSLISNPHPYNNSEIETFRSSLRHHLCEAANASTENGSCSVCPVTWLLHEDKCYWFSHSIESWDQSYEDCLAKRSQLLVISNTGEQKFIQDTIKVKAWIGLNFKLPEKKWMWINGSPLNHTDGSPLSHTESQRVKANCGNIGQKGIYPDLCNGELHWICQKKCVSI
ncbi:killer cell lectin-like receptor subfamily B member 1B allele C isoform X1 [Python bivittatus]|uniref:Killer cell lectin-like receptor subfamily B member 1B allele C isoform X1 n=1 Tax=Python bivittatus TaxID=176946 RepID=A0A9F3QUD8_PYTBI|nr:killer cell lectin-like receptor subfamily B member 1B allele C isoform X1 [Python bivittatus]